MAYPTIAATNTSQTNANATSHTVSLPSGISAGHLLLIFLATDGDNTVTNWNGFTPLFNLSNGNDSSLSVGYKVAIGDEGGTIVITTSSSEYSSHISYRITGWESNFPPEVSTGATNTNAAPDPDSVTPSWAQDDTLFIAVEGHDHTDTTDAHPANYTLSQLESTNANNSGCGAAASGRNLNASSEDPGTFTLSGSEQWVACTVAVSPSGASAAVEQQNTGQGSIAIAGAAKKKTSSVNFGQHVMTIVGALIKKTTPITAMGNYAIVITGVLKKLTKTIVGEYALSIAGTLTRKLSLFRAVGGYALGIAGTLIRKTTKLGLGAYAIVITGSLAATKKFFEAVGGYALSIIGSLATKLSAFRAVGQYSMTIVGTLKRKTVKLGLGAYSIVITGILDAVKLGGIYYQAVGSYALAIAGALSSLPKKLVGSYSMTIAGDLKKKISTTVGEYTMSIVGSLAAAKKFFKAVGSYAMSIAGTLSKKLSLFRAVGGYSMTITGTLVRKIVKLGLGAYSMTITGALSAVQQGILYYKAVGSYAMSIIGVLTNIFTSTHAIEDYVADSFITFEIEKDSQITFEIKKNSII